MVFLASGQAVEAHPDNEWKATIAFIGWIVGSLVPLLGLGVFVTLIVRAFKRRKVQRT